MSDVLPTAETAAPAAPARRGRFSMRALARRRSAVLGITGLVVIGGAALFAPWVAPHDPAAQDLGNILAPPFWDAAGSMEHPLGTDALGRDVASRLIHGARNSLMISFAAMLIGSMLGLTAGIVSGFLGGKVDTVTMRVGEIQLAFPFILLAIAILGVIPGRTPLHLILVLGIPGWIVYARVVRSRVLAERERDHVRAAAALGASRPRQLFRYVLPSVWQVVPVIAMLDIGFLVIMESMLSFLGLGLPTRFPSWGAMLAEGRRNMVISPWLSILPGLAIMLTVLSVNLTADGLADVFDPKLRKGTFRRVVLRLPSVGDRDVAAPRPAGSPDGPLLQVRDLRVEFPLPGRTIKAVRGVSFDLDRGETLGIVGESGSGKSVTALSIGQLLDSPGRVTGGQILFDGKDLTRIPDRAMAALRGRQLAMIFQNPTASLNPVFSIGFQMREAIRRHGRAASDPADVARDSLRTVGIGDPDRVLRQYPFQLSGGMNQRVMIAMAMAAHPDLLIADEPTTALDVTTQAQILERLRELIRAEGTSLIFITHDIALVAEYADRVLVMYAGQVCETGPTDQVINQPRHPYTQALLESVPRPDLPAGVRLEAIPGELPDPASTPDGCPFAPRCPHVMEVCRSVNPEQFLVAPDHRAACHLWSPDRTKAGTP
ncbi:MAG TPA: dipeptide/oligopeptide/nickel ABC transporter permease/ATP-binding protein [Jiangellaceae bacterium]|nr:dipeptide/oligopeptide/nickel ABC transporter permease/ATP-binding protein [Jiangellaceae bacterium]